MAAQTQTALALTGIGKPLEKITLPIPDPQENELLIKMNVAGTIPLDQKLRDYNLFDIGEHLPAVLTYDLVGTVVKAGPGTNTAHLPTGSKVFSQGLIGKGTAGGLQEFTVIDARFTALVPSTINTADAAFFPTNAFTSATVLFTTEGAHRGFGIPWPLSPEAKTFDYKNAKLVIIGGGTNCGKFGIQFARLAGIGTIVATASLSSASELETLGATHVIDRNSTDAAQQIRDIVGDDLIYCYDTFNLGEAHNLAVSVLSNTKKGTLIHLLPGAAGENIVKEKKAGYEERQANGTSAAHPEFGKLFWKQFPGLIDSGDIRGGKYTIIKGLDTDKINKAFDAMGRGEAERYHVEISN